MKWITFETAKARGYIPKQWWWIDVECFYPGPVDSKKMLLGIRCGFEENINSLDEKVNALNS